MFFMRTAKALSDSADAGLSLRWVHMSFYWFCHDAAHLLEDSGSLRTAHVFFFFFAYSVVLKGKKQNISRIQYCATFLALYNS